MTAFIELGAKAQQIIDDAMAIPMGAGPGRKTERAREIFRLLCDEFGQSKVLAAAEAERKNRG